MVDLFQAFILSVIQGLTEFLPVSSSAHLILLPTLLGWVDQGLAFDIAVHVGTLVAVLSYFRKDINRMIRAWWTSLLTREQTPYSRLAWAVGFATIPVGLAGLVFKGLVEQHLRSNLVIAVTTVGFGLLLGLASWLGKREHTEQNIGWKEVLMIGGAQALAIIPGTSRSGITMTAGLMMGLTRQAAARFSFLLAIPVIVLAGGLETVQLIKGQTPVNWEVLAFGFCLSAAFGYVCIHFFLKLLDKIGVLPFVIYRVLLGAFLVYVFYA